MKFAFFLKIRLLFNIFYCFCMFVNKHFIYLSKNVRELSSLIFLISGTFISKSKRCYNGKPSTYYFYVKTKVPVDFHICISVPLTFVKKCHFLLFLIFCVSLTGRFFLEPRNVLFLISVFHLHSYN